MENFFDFHFNLFKINFIITAINFSVLNCIIYQESCHLIAVHVYYFIQLFQATLISLFYY